MKNEDAYKLVSAIASPSDSEGLTKERAILLLWFLRNVMGIDDLEAYEYVCDGDNDQGIDGLFLEAATESNEMDTLVVFQSKYPTSLKNIGVSDVRSLVGTAAPLRTLNGYLSLTGEALEPELRALLGRFDVEGRLKADRLRVRLVLVAAGILTPEARRLLESTNESEQPDFITCYDLRDLAPIIEAYRSPTTVTGSVTVACSTKDRFIARTSTGRVAVCSVKVADIVKWPGIDDRRLFDLNVRRELSHNSVRRALDRAIRKPADHQNFIAFHNGLTVICEHLDVSSNDEVVVKNMSVVNGAQSTVAFKDNASVVTDKLRVVVKFVEVRPDRHLAREVAIRSNTQNPVNARNLRARDGIQLRLVQEFKDNFPHLTYELRPDATLGTAGATIQNDDAAQLISAVINETPWIAIRRTSLFEADRYPTIFTPRITAAHIVLLDLIGARVQEGKNRFPKEYLRSWRLTKLVGCYLVGEIARASERQGSFLKDPASALKDIVNLTARIDRLVKFAAAAMKNRRDALLQANKLDDFKVDFKREDALKALAADARKSYVTYETVESE